MSWGCSEVSAAVPRQFGKVDVSVGWVCERCPRKHAPGSACPPVGVWLVLAFCRACDPKAERYCSRHRDRNAPPLQLVDIPPPPGEQDEYRRRIGEEGAA